jgi:uncharacterized protein involved in exopolysaccharide biosynthesis
MVLDHALVPDRKAKPKGTIFAVVGFVSSFIVGLLIAFFMELFNNIKITQPEKYEYLTGWFRFKKSNR